LPITPDAITKQKQLWTSHADDSIVESIQSQAGPCMARTPQSLMQVMMEQPCATVAMFAHSVQTRANTVKFGHQVMCNPKISLILKALGKGFLKGCPNLSEELVTKYLNPSPATAKGHMKRPKKEIRSTAKKPKQRVT
jgi:hypothetical protein